MRIAMSDKNSEIKKGIFALKYSLAVFTVFSVAFSLLKFPETAGQGISDGIDLCLGTLIPSLYPFMIISSLTVNLRLFSLIENLLSKLTEFVFRLPGKALSVIILSMIGGFPVGGKMVKEMYKKGEITDFQGKRLLLFCVNPGPAFTLSSVGFYMLGSKKAGAIIYISLIVSSFIICFVTRFLDNDLVSCRENTQYDEHEPFSQSLVKSVSSGSKSMLSVCSFVIAFSCINRLIEIIPLNTSVRFFLFCILEVTNACAVACGNLSVPIIAGIIGFGGICTHFQVMDAIDAVKLKYKYFITSRIVHGALSAVICDLILKFYPVSYDVFSFGTLPSKSVSGISVPLSIGMLVMCGLFMLGDSFRIKIKKAQVD